MNAVHSENSSLQLSPYYKNLLTKQSHIFLSFQELFKKLNSFCVLHKKMLPQHFGSSIVQFSSGLKSLLKKSLFIVEPDGKSPFFVKWQQLGWTGSIMAISIKIKTCKLSLNFVQVCCIHFLTNSLEKGINPSFLS